MLRFTLNEETDGKPNLNIIGRGSQISKKYGRCNGRGVLCVKKANSKGY